MITRAEDRCEFCRMPQKFEHMDYKFDHIIAQKHHGPTTLENLAYSCFQCNCYKGPNLAGFDPLTKRVIRLFHPRKDRWVRHLKWDGPILIGLTSIGRVTVYVLNINDPDAVALREIMLDDGLFL